MNPAGRGPATPATLAAGGTAPRAPQDHGFMYAHGYEDLDGHIWELVYMDTSAAANPAKDA